MVARPEDGEGSGISSPKTKQRLTREGGRLLSVEETEVAVSVE